MTRRSTVEIACPDCGMAAPFTIWDSINTTLNPELKQKVLDRSLFRFVCPSCGTTHEVSYGFIYHQMEDRVLILHAPAEDSLREDISLFSDPKGPARGFMEQGYLIRAVHSLAQLAEKIEIFDAHLDDRIIEIYKQYLLPLVEDNLSARPEEGIELYFGVRDDGEQGFDIFVDGKHEMTSPFAEDLYHSLEADYRDGLPDFRSDSLVIDGAYAVRAIRVHLERDA